jgi:two-component system nitrate/nitrite response regulator NarL
MESMDNPIIVNHEGHSGANGNGNGFVHTLTKRETSILRALTEGKSNKEIALRLVITESTIKVHMKVLLRKLRLRNRTQAAMWARSYLPAQ